MQNTFTESNLAELHAQIRRTESMDGTERNLWLELLPSMTEDHKHRLLDILLTEDAQLKKIEGIYNHDVREMIKSEMIEWTDVHKANAK